MVKLTRAPLQVALPPCRLLRIPRSAYEAALESTRPAGLPLVRHVITT